MIVRAVWIYVFLMTTLIIGVAILANGCASGGSTVDVSVDDPIVGGGDVVCNPDDPEDDCPEE